MPSTSREPNLGISARDLAEADLLRELTSLKTKQHDIESDGTADQKANHIRRTAELESEFLTRFGADSPRGPGQHDDSGAARPQPGMSPGAGKPATG